MTAAIMVGSPFRQTMRVLEFATSLPFLRNQIDRNLFEVEACATAEKAV